MSGKYLKNKKKKKQAPLVVILLIAVALLALVIGAVVLLEKGGIDTPGTEPQITEEQPQPVETTPATESFTYPGSAEVETDTDLMDLGEGLVITKIGNYTGLYMEDGTDEVVSGILMVELENTSDKDLQLAFIKLHYGEEEAVFQVTNLPAGKRLVALEKNRMAYRSELPDSAVAENTAFLDAFTMHDDEIELVALDGVINVVNKSDRDIETNIYVYYKNKAAGVYYGGITYRVTIEGGLKAGEIRQIMTAHYDAEGSEILMVSYGQ